MYRPITLMRFLIILGFSMAAVCAASAADLAPEVQNENGISYVSGGIGDQSQQAMEELASDFNLQLTFAQAQGGNYLADVPVIIQDDQGNSVLEVVSEGPIFYADLDPGAYTVMASSDGEVRERQVEIQEGSSSTVHFTW